MKRSLMPNLMSNIFVPIFVNPTYCQIQGLFSRHHFCSRGYPADHDSGHSVGFAIRRYPYGILPCHLPCCAPQVYCDARTSISQPR